MAILSEVLASDLTWSVLAGFGLPALCALAAVAVVRCDPRGSVVEAGPPQRKALIGRLPPSHGLRARRRRINGV